MADETIGTGTCVDAGADTGASAMHPPLTPGAVVRHFKRETVPAAERAAGNPRYLYRYLGVVHHSETQEALVAYEALYPPYGVWVRPYAMFMGEVDHAKYPAIRQRWRFEAVGPDETA